ncbi:MAG TPA: 4Fe-4S dicluster domain-containing protein [Anaeromyxobacter sp.]|nr:4Fe-4S dicluster domain-containing protein [Anaeromyxobacter sp.]
MAERPKAVLQATRAGTLIEVLARRGYQVIGPTVRDGAIVYDLLGSGAELPAGVGDEQQPGCYRLRRRDDDALFGYALGPYAWKRFLHPAEVRLFSAARQDSSFRVLEEPEKTPPRYAFLGVRPCELAAIEIQDRVLLGEGLRDAVYQARREDLFLVAVQCTEPAATCFCASMETGPRAREGFDLALTELQDSVGHRFLVEAGTERGSELLAELETAPASAEDEAAAEAALSEAQRRQVRSMDRSGLPELLQRNLEHPRWEQTAERCLCCANCTMVCPTCFCTTVEDRTDVARNRAERWRRWDSCLTLSFSYIHGGSVRASAKARYRQWLTHKLSSWVDQFGRLGCVGCGRCIAWCPAGIDLTEEVRAIRGS